MEEIKFKFSVNWTKTTFYCGLDVHKHELAVAIYTKDDSLSEFVKATIFSVTSKGLSEFWSFVSKYRPVGFAMEATGIYHHIIYKFLVNKRSHVHWPFSIVVVNPADAAGLPGRQKFDRIDAEHLARYLAMGLLRSGKPVIEVLEDLKAVFRMAARLERERMALKNRIKKILDRAGIRPKHFDLNKNWTVNFLELFIEQEDSLGRFIEQELGDKTSPLQKSRTYLIKNLKHLMPFFNFSLTPTQRALIRQDLVELNFKTGRKALLAVEVDQVLLDRPGLRARAHDLSTIPGISPFSAVWILAEIGNIKMYRTYKHFLSYCGCCPRIVSSGNKVYSAHTQRHSNTYLLTIFYNAAVVLCNFTKKKSALKIYADRVNSMKSFRNKKLVYCIVAGKIAKIAYTLLKNKVPFTPELGDPVILNPPNGSFSLSDKKLIRKVRNNLRRVKLIPNIGDTLGAKAEELLKELERVMIK
ncbi:MAG: IS110 family transposase [Promethearchaeota archaeon]